MSGDPLKWNASDMLVNFRQTFLHTDHVTQSFAVETALPVGRESGPGARVSFYASYVSSMHVQGVEEQLATDAKYMSYCEDASSASRLLSIVIASIRLGWLLLLLLKVVETRRIEQVASPRSPCRTSCNHDPQ